MANEIPKPLVTITVLYKTFPYVCSTVQWPYSKRKLQIATVMMQVCCLPLDCITRGSGQDSQQKRKQGLAKTSRHENSTVHANIKVVNWLTKYKQYKLTFQSYVLLDSPSGPTPRFRGIVMITVRRGLHGATLHASRQWVHWLLNSLATKS